MKVLKVSRITFFWIAKEVAGLPKKLKDYYYFFQAFRTILGSFGGI
jgi:hypothetical protein